MPDPTKARMSIWVEPDDREDMATIKKAFGLPTDSSAIRYAIRRLAQEIEDQRAAKKAAA
jgi:hypothetical protein